MEEQYLREIANQLNKLNSKFEKLIESLTKASNQLINENKKDENIKLIGSCGDVNITDKKSEK